ncbi:MAG TPA: competence/damage-inducible protein A [Acidimicrobiales bacterium]|nr:competence/damage-inducible protein A [Acidimicrobiales bacterium]
MTADGGKMRAEIVAIGTELLLGQIVDTNSTWIAEQLAVTGIDCLYQSRVGDNIDRIVDVLTHALSRSDAVITCGGLGPTQDDITREAIAKMMGVELLHNDEAERRVREMFSSRGREMTENNLRQAEVPEGASIISQVIGSAPGLICPIGDKVIYALPGVPHEMREMVTRAVLEDLSRRSGETATIRSRILRTFGVAESKIAEIVSPRFEALEQGGADGPRIAFLASGIEGVKVRITVKAATEEVARVRLDEEELALRGLLGESVFGVDDETMEYALGEVLRQRGLTLGLAESFTGGLISSRIVAVVGASRWFRGSLVAYNEQVKFQTLGVPLGPVISGAAAIAMAEGACSLLGSDVAISTTGVAGPDEQEGQSVGTCFVGLVVNGRPSESLALRLSGDRQRIRELATIAALGNMRRILLDS